MKMHIEDELDLARQTFEGIAMIGATFTPMARLEIGGSADLALIPADGIEKWEMLATLCREVEATRVVFIVDSRMAFSDPGEPLPDPGADPAAQSVLMIYIMSDEGTERHCLPYHFDDREVIWEPEYELPDNLSNDGALLVQAALS
jgi:hypothetical protein